MYHLSLMLKLSGKRNERMYHLSLMLKLSGKRNERIYNMSLLVKLSGRRNERTTLAAGGGRSGAAPGGRVSEPRV
jgi:hypothetical protein